MNNLRNLMKQIKGCAAVFCFVVAGVFMGSATYAADINLKAYTYTGGGTTVAMMEKMVSQFEADMGGAAKVKLNVGGSLPIKGGNITQAVAEGIVDISGDAFYAGNLPIGGLMFLPALFLNSDDLQKGYDAAEPYMRAALAEMGVELLTSYWYPLQVLWSRDDNLDSLDKLKGMKTRVSSPEQGEFIKRFGGIPVTLGSPEVVPALQRGIIDNVITASSGGGRTYRGNYKSTFRIGPNLHMSLIIANKKTFDALPADAQNALVKAAKDATAWAIVELEAGEETWTETFQTEDNVKVYYPTEEEVASVLSTMKSYWPEWAEERGPDAVEALGKVLEALGK